MQKAWIIYFFGKRRFARASCSSGVNIESTLNSPDVQPEAHFLRTCPVFSAKAARMRSICPMSRTDTSQCEISFEQFRDTVVSYLAPEDRAVYDKAAAWDDIKLKVTEFIDKIGQDDA